MTSIDAHCVPTSANSPILVETPMNMTEPTRSPLDPSDDFAPRHIGPSSDEIEEMLSFLGYDSLDSLSKTIVPDTIQVDTPLRIPSARTERRAVDDLRNIVGQNKVYRSFIGMGYSGTITPPVIARNILENPGWYTQYTPYQAEISQGRLEALLTFQTMVADLTGLPVAGASLLDEPTAAAEAMAMCYSIAGASAKRNAFFIADHCHPQTISVVRTRARSMGVEITVGDPADFDPTDGSWCGAIIQYPTTDGRIIDHKEFCDRLHAHDVLVAVAADILALTAITPPGEFGADIAIGSTQRFGVPLGFGGPHAAYLATREQWVRRMPGRLIGISRDQQGNPAYRMAIQTREQHIKRERATSNICTAQALLAIMAATYAVYHGPDGLKRIADRIHSFTAALIVGVERLGHRTRGDGPVFDTVRIELSDGCEASDVHNAAARRGINLRAYDDGTVGVSFDETTTREDFANVLIAFNDGKALTDELDSDSLLTVAQQRSLTSYGSFERHSAFMEHQVFHQHRSETELLRYLTRLQSRDLSLAQSMIPLGSCTMKLNATSEMIPISWPELADIHPAAPADQTVGYAEMAYQLEQWLGAITGFDAVSLQPNAGSQGEYAGLLAIRAYHESRGDTDRRVCLIPRSAHGTNPASAVIAGFQVVVVDCDRHGNIDLSDLRDKAQKHSANLGALMITYPSTHGVFEPQIREVCDCIHEHGGQVYMDGANMNAQVGLCNPADMGADVCHLNLHKTFCIPHGGGGPGMGPIGVRSHLAPFLPGTPGDDSAPVGAVSGARLGSASILAISWAYIAMMGPRGLRRATQVAILNANYMAKRLSSEYEVLYAGIGGGVAHEFILDFRPFEQSAGIKVEDVAKRLMDYGFHAPTMSFPVPGTLMIEPTESESLAELDRFCEAMLSIREEIRAIEEGTADREDNVLKNAPHPIATLTSNDWSHPYSREQAAFPLDWLREGKFWPPVGRIDNPYGDRNLICTCPPLQD